jgi:hypothetical protein
MRRHATDEPVFKSDFRQIERRVHAASFERFGRGTSRGHSRSGGQFSLNQLCARDAVAKVQPKPSLKRAISRAWPTILFEIVASARFVCRAKASAKRSSWSFVSIVLISTVSMVLIYTVEKTDQPLLWRRRQMV